MKAAKAKATPTEAPAAKPTTAKVATARAAKASAPPAAAAGDDELERLARAAQAVAYAPYSNFRVGAALVAADGRIFTGANVENASYGLTVCAERNAVMAMVLAGSHDIRTIYVASDIAPPASPCGMCRQTLLEFARDPATTHVVAVGPGADHVGWTLAELIPHGFTGDELGRPRPASARPPTKTTSSPRRARPTKAL